MFDKKQFKQLIEKAIGNKTITEFCKESGVNNTYISKYLNLKLDSPPNPEILKKIANNSEKVTYGDLMVAAGYMSKEFKGISFNKPRSYYKINDLKDSKYKIIDKDEKKVPVSKSYNKDLLNPDNIIEYKSFPPKYIRNNSFSIKIEDNRFQNLGIFKNDYILINPITDPGPGNTLFIEIDGKKTIKRYYPINENMVKLEPANHNNEPIKKDNINIIGQVVFLQREFY